jgi:hypothetical protein
MAGEILLGLYSIFAFESHFFHAEASVEIFVQNSAFR